MANGGTKNSPLDVRDLPLARERGREENVSREPTHQEAGWKVLGFLGLLLAVIGLVDVLLNLYPPAFESPEWKFGTVTRMLTSLPLATVGFAGLAAWAFARGGRTSRVAVGVASLVVLAVIAAAYVLFLLNVPLAWSAVGGPQGPAIVRSLIRTTVMGIGFGIGYLVLAIALLRTSTSRRGR